MRGFRRNKTAPATMATEDRLIAAYSGYTPEQWAQLPELVRKDARENITWNMP